VRWSWFILAGNALIGYLACMRIKLLVVLGIAWTATVGAETKPVVHFLSHAEASAALTGTEAQGYYGQLQVAELRAKTGLPLEAATVDAAREASRKAYGAATVDFADDERAALSDAVDSMQPVLTQRAPLYARTPWCFIKVKGFIEGGLPHTRGDCIVLADSVLRSIATAHAKARFDHPSQVWDLLLHEQSHVLQRRHPELFAPLYTDVFGFRKVELTAPDWLILRRVVNPDAPRVEWIYALGASGAARHWVLPDIELTDLEHPKMPDNFKVVALGVHPVDGGHWALDDAMMPASQADLESISEYVDAFPVKGEAFHPNEIAAEMLSEIIMNANIQHPEHPLWARTRDWAEMALR
jgi:hypothetical protein